MEEKKLILTFCPKCESSNVMQEFLPMYSLVIMEGLHINNWKCADCGFSSPVFPEKVFDDIKELEKHEKGGKENGRKQRKI